MKEYGRLLGDDEARRFSARVLDVHEWLAPRLHRLPPVAKRAKVVVQDPCHLRHVQRAHEDVRTCLRHAADVIEIPDDGLCCGAGGAYSFVQRELALRIRDRKVEAIGHLPRDAVVASANPGCSQHLAAAGIRVRHPIDIIAESLAESSPDSPAIEQPREQRTS